MVARNVLAFDNRFRLPLALLLLLLLAPWLVGLGLTSSMGFVITRCYTRRFIDGLCVSSSVLYMLEGFASSADLSPYALGYTGLRQILIPCAINCLRLHLNWLVGVCEDMM